jgi:hypothetical protein
MEFWMTPVRWANSEFSAHFSSRGKAKSLSSLPMDGFSVRRWRFPAFRYRSAVDGVPLRDQARENAASGITTFLGWLLLPA